VSLLTPPYCGESVQRVPYGPGGLAVAVPGGYAQPAFSDTDGGGWRSSDGVAWSHVDQPAIP
jgi:hypothetical protein